jgi:3-oxoacyl-[acyl-carrier protein] reductase
LTGKVALITGVSRRRGIGFAIARRLARDGAALALQGWPAYDREQPWGMDRDDQTIEELTQIGGRVVPVCEDLRDVHAPARLLEAAHATLGRVDILVLNHTHSTSQSLEALSAEEIDRHLAVNVRASLLLVAEFARRATAGSAARVIFMTSGQHLGPMPGELAYVASKGALHALIRSLSDHLMQRGITVNGVNPGPTDTGWADAETRAAVEERMPLRRWGTPDDAARAVAWLASEEAGWITGQVLDSEGGFRR